MVDGGLEAEVRVIRRVPEEHDRRLVERVGGSDHGMHQRAADPGPLPVRPNSDRAEPERRPRPDPGAAADHVPDDVTVVLGH